MNKIKCPGCQREMTSIDVFHVAECSAKQMTLENPEVGDEVSRALADMLQRKD